MNRIGSAFIALILMVGQLYYCQAGYELPDGSSCLVCPSLTLQEAENSAPGLPESIHNDCHDCCTFEVCDGSDEEPESTLPDRWSDVFCLEASLPDFDPGSSIAEKQLWLEYSTGPPSSQTLGTYYVRGPPSHS